MHLLWRNVLLIWSKNSKNTYFLKWYICKYTIWRFSTPWHCPFETKESNNISPSLYFPYSSQSIGKRILDQLTQHVFAFSINHRPSYIKTAKDWVFMCDCQIFTIFTHLSFMTGILKKQQCFEYSGESLPHF